MEIGSSAGLATSVNVGIARSQQALQGIQSAARDQQQFAQVLSQSAGASGGAAASGFELETPSPLGGIPGNNASGGAVTGDRGSLLNIVV